jgi:hypothetical protein
MLAALAPLLTWLSVAAVLRGRIRWRITWRDALLVAATLAAAWLVLGTELLSLFHAIRFGPVLMWWLAPLPVLVTLAATAKDKRRYLPAWPRLSWYDGMLLLVIVAALGWALCQAWFSPPNNVDSQEYHLQRQVFWLQQGSVEHFPTSNLRQVAMPPLTEFAGLTLMVLSGGDRYHNLVQWLALMLTLCAVALLTRRFNRSPTAQLTAAAWVVTLPLAFMQASTTKNDVVVILFACLLAYWTLLLDTRARLRWPLVALIGLGFGALALTKGTGIIFGLPIGLMLAVVLWRRHRILAAPALVTITLLALALNAGHFARNERAFGSVAPDQPGIHDGPALGNADHSLGALASNVIRAVASHCVTPSQSWNDGVTAFVRTIHQKLGRDVDDPNTTWIPLGRFRPYRWWQRDEDRAAAPAHLVLALLLPVVLWWTRREIPWKPTLMLAGCAIAGFVLFCWVLKWQNWHVRLIMVSPALIAPVFGWSFGRRRLRWLGAAAIAFLLVTLGPSLNSMEHPMWGPRTIFNADPLALRCYYRPMWPAEYRDLAGRIAARHARVIGFFTGPGSPDYPMQRLLLDQLSPSPTFTAFNGKLQVPGKSEPDPDVLLVVRSNARELQHQSTGTWYTLATRVGRYGLFVKRAAPLAVGP